jgi:hypothetical protein
MGCCENKLEVSQTHEVNLGSDNLNKSAEEPVIRIESAEFRDISLNSESTPHQPNASQGTSAKLGLEISFIQSNPSNESIKLLTPKFSEIPRKISNPNSPKFSFASTPTMISEDNEFVLMPHAPLNGVFDGAHLPEILQEGPNDLDVSEYSQSLTPEKTLVSVSFRVDNAEFGKRHAEQQPAKSVKDLIKDLNSFFDTRKVAEISAIDVVATFVDKPVVQGRRPRTIPKFDSLP